MGTRTRTITADAWFYIDDVAFFDIALSAAQIKALYESPQTINAGNLLSQNL